MVQLKDRSKKTSNKLPTEDSLETRRLLKENGWVLLPKLPANCDWKDVVPSLTQALLMPQDAGEIVYNVKSVWGNENLSDSKSQNALRPHTEASYLPVPPEYLAIYGVLPSACGGGHTTLADGCEFLKTLTEREQNKLMRYRCEFVSKDGKSKFVAPILEMLPHNRIMFRFSYNILVYSHPSPELDAHPVAKDPFLRDICDRCIEFFEDFHEAIRIEKGSLLVFDNYRMLHSRTAYSDPSRHLQRIWLL